MVDAFQGMLIGIVGKWRSRLLHVEARATTVTKLRYLERRSGVTVPIRRVPLGELRRSRQVAKTESNSRLTVVIKMGALAGRLVPAPIRANQGIHSRSQAQNDIRMRSKHTEGPCELHFSCLCRRQLRQLNQTHVRPEGDISRCFGRPCWRQVCRLYHGIVGNLHNYN